MFNPGTNQEIHVTFADGSPAYTRFIGRVKQSDIDRYGSYEKARSALVWRRAIGL